MSDSPDPKDADLLRLLQQDARLSNAELADRTAMSASSCWRRVRAMEERGVITRYAALVDPARLGLTFEAVVHVELTRHDPEAMAAFIAAVQRQPEVVECLATTGAADYHLRVICRDIEAYNRFLDDVLFRLPGLRGAQTNVVLKKIKSQGPIVP